MVGDLMGVPQEDLMGVPQEDLMVGQARVMVAVVEGVGK
jgi:hypothetical protein